MMRTIAVTWLAWVALSVVAAGLAFAVFVLVDAALLYSRLTRLRRRRGEPPDAGPR